MLSVVAVLTVLVGSECDEMSFSPRWAILPDYDYGPWQTPAVLLNISKRSALKR